MNRTPPREIPLLACDAVALNLYRGRQTQDRRPLGTRPEPRVGDLYYVRECFAIVPATAYRCSDWIPHRVSPCGLWWVVYRAGWERSAPGPWRPSIHMPKWAARTWLAVTECAVERLHEITDRGCFAEGVDLYIIPRCGDHPDLEGWVTRADGELGAPHVEPRQAFARLWDSVYGSTPHAWERNPEVYATTFERDETRSVDCPDPATMERAGYAIV
jgi:hypothetical protein